MKQFNWNGEGVIEGENGEVVVVHDRLRRDLFLPSRLWGGEAPRQALTGYRETHCMLVGETVERVVRDNWTSRMCPTTSTPWSGWTMFRRSTAPS